jgi:hypothetical protein
MRIQAKVVYRSLIKTIEAPVGSGGNVAGLCWESVKHQEKGENGHAGQAFRQAFGRRLR